MQTPHRKVTDEFWTCNLFARSVQLQPLPHHAADCKCNVYASSEIVFLGLIEKQNQRHKLSDCDDFYVSALIIWTVVQQKGSLMLTYIWINISIKLIWISNAGSSWSSERSLVPPPVAWQLIDSFARIAVNYLQLGGTQQTQTYWWCRAAARTQQDALEGSWEIKFSTASDPCGLHFCRVQSVIFLPHYLSYYTAPGDILTQPRIGTARLNSPSKAH